MSNADKDGGSPILTISMPYWRSLDVVRRAVDSILNQSFTDFRLIVVNDGGDPSCWEPLADIEDPRLVRFDLDQNRGRYYADAVTLAACETEWWTPHDSDDESLPERYENLLAAANKDTLAVFGAAKTRSRHGKWSQNPVRPEKRPSPTSLRHFSKYPAAIYKTEAARLIGGPHPDLRASYDTSFMCLFWAGFPSLLKVVQEPLYIVHKRDGSLTTASTTGTQVNEGGPSAWRSVQRRRSRALYYKALGQPSSRWASVLAPSEQTKMSLKADITRLSAVLSLAIIE